VYEERSKLLRSVLPKPAVLLLRENANAIFGHGTFNEPMSQTFTPGEKISPHRERSDPVGTKLLKPRKKKGQPLKEKKHRREPCPKRSQKAKDGRREFKTPSTHHPRGQPQVRNGMVGAVNQGIKLPDTQGRPGTGSSCRKRSKGPQHPQYNFGLQRHLVPERELECGKIKD